MAAGNFSTSKLGNDLFNVVQAGERRTKDGTVTRNGRKNPTEERGGKCLRFPRESNKCKGGADAEHGDSSAPRIRNTCIPVVYGD